MLNLNFNHVTFALPARQFVINSSVTVNESLPKVTEFVLRLIKLCEEVSSEEVAKYFGFSGKETRLILDFLSDQSLVLIEGDIVRLTEYAKSKFYTDDDMPRFSVVMPRTDIIDFDLLTFHPNDGRNRIKSPPFTAEIKISEENIGSSTRFAEQAYQKHFHRILRTNEKSKDKIEIYKISNVQSKKLFDIPLDVTFSLDSHCEIERVVNYDEDAPEDFRIGIEQAISDALMQPMSMQSNWLKEFIERFDDKLLNQYFSKKGFEFEKYIRDVFIDKITSYSGPTQPMLGNFYMPENQEIILSYLKSSFNSEVEKKSFNLFTSAVWLAPENKFWGRTAHLEDFYFRVLDSLPQLKKSSKSFMENLHILCPGTKESSRVIQQQLWSKKEKSLHFFNGDVMGCRVEILFIPLKMACVIFHYAPPGNSSVLVPFGFITTAPELIKEAQVLLFDSTNSGANYIGKAKFNNESPQPDKFEQHFGFINYCGA